MRECCHFLVVKRGNETVIVKSRKIGGVGGGGGGGGGADVSQDQ